MKTKIDTIASQAGAAFIAASRASTPEGREQHRKAALAFADELRTLLATGDEVAFDMQSCGQPA